jgi:hypothetical protein
METLIKFVQFNRPLKHIIGESAESLKRLSAVDTLRQYIEKALDNTEDDNLRIIVKRQNELWQEGVAAARLIGDSAIERPTEGDEVESEENDSQD